MIRRNLCTKTSRNSLTTSHRLFPLTARDDCLNRLQEFKAKAFWKCLPSAFPFLLPSLRGSCVDNFIPDHWIEIIIPLLVVLKRHIRAIVYQELYDVTTPFPVLRTRYSMSFTCWVPCWYNRLRPTWPHSEVQSCCCYLKRQFRS